MKKHIHKHVNECILYWFKFLYFFPITYLYELLLFLEQCKRVGPSKWLTIEYLKGERPQSPLDRYESAGGSEHSQYATGNSSVRPSGQLTRQFLIHSTYSPIKKEFNIWVHAKTIFRWNTWKLFFGGETAELLIARKFKHN